MQGFNMGRYRPYDADPSKESFNARSGKHPLGDRARKLDQGILIVRFELPFNVWCDGCDNHIGQGVRYNAEKRKVGHYLSTPIFAFRCKCHLCSNWFEIRTDPQHTRYVVESGARKQNQEWDADANGSFSIELGDAGPSTWQTEAAKDPFAGVEKAENAKVQVRTAAQRMAELEDLSERHTSDPYSLNAKLRKRHRKEKRETLRQGEADDAVRKRLGWSDDIGLARDDESLRADAASAWREARLKRDAQHTEDPVDARQLLASKVSGPGRADGPKSHRLAPASSKPPRPKSGTSTPSAAQLLASKLASSARKERDPFMKVMRDSLQRK